MVIVFQQKDILPPKNHVFTGEAKAKCFATTINQYKYYQLTIAS